MNILLAGALSWNPERIVALAERGHRLFGVWSRTMAWEQGPYPFAKGLITDVNVDEAIGLLHEKKVDVVYTLFQSYDRTLWAKGPSESLPDIWTLLSTLLQARAKGAFDAPIVRHWGFDIHTVDLEVARELDGQIFCNRQKFDYWMLPRSAGGCGLDFGTASQSIAFMDGDLPSASFMNDAYSPKLSDASGEIHTVCVGRPLGIDISAAARNGIHVHVYGNGLDDIAMCIAHTQRMTDSRSIQQFLPFLHVHQSLQPTGGTLREIQEVKNRWVQEFSQYDAGWSYVGRPLPWPVLDDRAAIPNRLGTYMLAGLPVISERLPGFYRHEVLAAAGAAIGFNPKDYASLAATLRDHEQLSALTANTRISRERFSFESTLDELLSFLTSAIEHRGERSSRRAPGVRQVPSDPIAFAVRPFSVRGMLSKPAAPGTVAMRVANNFDDLWSRLRWFFARTIGRRALARELARPRRGS